jgi:hypothetical protein
VWGEPGSCSSFQRSSSTTWSTVFAGRPQYTHSGDEARIAFLFLTYWESLLVNFNASS